MQEMEPDAPQTEPRVEPDEPTLAPAAPDCSMGQLMLPVGLMTLLLIILFVVCPRIRAYRLNQVFLGPSTSVIDLDLSRRDLHGKNLANITLWNVKLEGTNLAAANLSGAWLDSLNMASADLADANLQDAWLTGANLTGADLTRANLTGVHYDNLTRWPRGFDLQSWKSRMVYEPPS